MQLHAWRKIVKYIAGTAFLLLLLLYIYGTPLPKKNAILPEVRYGAPLQKNIADTNIFQKRYGDMSYAFTPRATYTLPGLVVALHHSDSWIDISHENDPAQTVDICVVWGDNITTNAYREVAYDHGDWTCYYSWGGEEMPAFSGDLLSNTHLIPQSSKDARIIKSIKVGDQILLSGLLTDYTITGEDGEILGARHTSLTRTDGGNGACEVLYLSSVTILKRNMPWRAPLMTLLWIITMLWLPLEIYLGIPRYRKRGDTLTGKPHVANPYNITNFLGNKVLHRKSAKEGVGKLEGNVTHEGQDTPKEERAESTRHPN